jgi:hypothetical protein
MDAYGLLGGQQDLSPRPNRRLEMPIGLLCTRIAAGKRGTRQDARRWQAERAAPGSAALPETSVQFRQMRLQAGGAAAITELTGLLGGLGR